MWKRLLVFLRLLQHTVQNWTDVLWYSVSLSSLSCLLCTMAAAHFSKAAKPGSQQWHPSHTWLQVVVVLYAASCLTVWPLPALCPEFPCQKIALIKRHNKWFPAEGTPVGLREYIACPGHLSNTQCQGGLWPRFCHGADRLCDHCATGLSLTSDRHSVPKAPAFSAGKTYWPDTLPFPRGHTWFSIRESWSQLFIDLEKSYKFLFLSPSETSSIVPYGMWHHGSFGKSLTASSLRRLWLHPCFCADHVSLYQGCSFLPEDCTPSFSHLGIQGSILYTTAPHPSHILTLGWEVPLRVLPLFLGSRTSFLVTRLWLVIALPLLMSDRKWLKQGAERASPSSF